MESVKICPRCSSPEASSKGYRKLKVGKVRVFKCKKCGRKFTPQPHDKTPIQSGCYWGAFLLASMNRVQVKLHEDDLPEPIGYLLRQVDRDFFGAAIAAM